MSGVTPDPWGAAGEAPLDPSLAGEAEAFDVEACFSRCFRDSAGDIAAMQRVALEALQGQFGHELALQLAPVLLPPLVSQAQEEAAQRTRNAMEDLKRRKERQRLLELTQASMQPW